MDPERFRQVEELYHAALEDRAVLANTDPELRREVESLLAQPSAPLSQLVVDLFADPTIHAIARRRTVGSVPTVSRSGTSAAASAFHSRRFASNV